MHYKGISELMVSKGMTMSPVFFMGALLAKLAGGISLILGYRTRWGVLLLMLFLVPSTFILHNFWGVEGADHSVQVEFFLKSCAIFGGLLYLLACGGGGCSCDQLRVVKAPKDRSYEQESSVE